MARAESAPFLRAGWIIRCPGCGYPHLFDERWTFNGDVERPTFRPELTVGPIGGGKIPHCRSLVTDGRVLFLDGTSHHLLGREVDLPDVRKIKAPEIEGENTGQKSRL